MNTSWNEISVSVRAKPRGLNLVLKQMQEVVVVVGVELDEYVILARGEVAFDHFGNLAQGVYHSLELRGVAEKEADVGAGVVSQSRGVDQQLRAVDYVVGHQALHALMHRGSRYAILAGYFQIRGAGIGAQCLQNHRVQIVEILSCHSGKC